MSPTDYNILNIHLGPSEANLPRSGAGFRRIVYSSENKNDAPVRPPPFGYLAQPQQMDDSDSDDKLSACITQTLSRRRRTARRNQFIDSEAGVDGAASEDEDDDDDDDLGGFIVDDDVIF